MKTCVLCGQDCSNRQRVKDRKGRYYCRACYSEAARRRRAAGASLEDTAGSTVDSGTDETRDDCLSALVDAGSTSASPSTELQCPGCGMSMPPGAVQCVECGYNMRTGKQLSVQVEPAAKGVKKRTRWPLIIGAVSVVIGSVTFVFNSRLLQSDVASGLASLPAVAVETLATLLGLWLVVAGVGVLRRKAQGVVWMRRWAIVKAALFTAWSGWLFLNVLSLRNEPDWVLEDLGVDPAGFDPATAMAILLVSLIWWFSWPAVIFVWFSRAKVSLEVSKWD